VEDVLPKAMEVYTKEADRKCSVIVDREEFLLPDSAGGVIALAHEGKIKVVNTLESRLALLSGQMLPDIRTRLFGANPSRRFMD